MKFIKIIALLFLINCTVSVHAENVQPGADRLFSEYFHLIKGKRVALVANHSAVLSTGKHLADALFQNKDVKLQVLFGMEFNIRSNNYADAHDPEKTIDSATGVLKYSLYGSIHKPTKEMLGKTEVIIFDIQETGLRFYEHVNILGFVMEAAAENNIEVIVLDRPNPINGVAMDGFVTEDKYLYTFGAYAKIPIRHGMTIGELARFYVGEKALRGGKSPKLHVIDMKGWKRAMWFDETGLPWKKPSPNLLTLTSVIAYGGTCLFEGLNVSEGRGTDHPFENIGAPWLDHKKVVELLTTMKFEGVRFEANTFVPEQKSYLGRPPELSGETCNGVFIHITDRKKFELYKVGVALLWAINSLHADKLVWKDATIQRLSGTDRLLTMIRAGDKPEKIFQSWETEVAAFASKRKVYLATGY
jgi:uncharacterized protein YbbC (DUF1343 family)